MARRYDDLEASIDKYDKQTPGFRAKFEKLWAIEKAKLDAETRSSSTKASRQGPRAK